MSYARRQAITAFRNDPLHEVLNVVGFDLTGVTLALAVKLAPDVSGSPLVQLAMTTTPGDEGIRFVSVATDGDGVPSSLLEIMADKATMEALPAAVEPGDDVTLAYDLQWTLPATGGLTSVEETVMYGEFIVKGSVNG